MDKADAVNIAQRYAGAVKANYNYIKIILFGSYAKGNFNDDSDIDIAVIFKDYSNLIDMQLELMRLRRKIDSRIEPHPFRESEFELSNPIVNEIIKYGQEIKINAAK
ncbi:MAG TPA: nucleotidyltransferase [Prolixibacteraceae bacterium]|nr:nucleotidyltransferase [Prolixibacteraceae bacterium]